MFQKHNSRELIRGLEGWAVVFMLTVLSSAMYVHRSAPAELALQFAEHDAAVQEAVGGVEKAKLGWIGNIHYAGNNGWASFKMHVVGGRTNGTMDITLQRQLGKWNVAVGKLVTDSGHIVKIDGTPIKQDTDKVE
jgi:hypothetical protein